MPTVYLWAKTLHVVAVVAWFAGLFYLPRLFVYHAEALAGPEPARAVLHAQFARMERILERAIMRPAVVLVVVAGTVMATTRPALMGERWLQVKLALVALVVAYHWSCVRCTARLATGATPMTAQQFRLFNEAPTVLLVLVVFLVIFQRQATAGAALALAGGFALLLVAGVAAAARRRAARALPPACGVPVRAVPLRTVGS